MPNRNKQRGYEHEAAFVRFAEECNLIAKRSWGSNGQASGLAKEVDVLLDHEYRIQCKRMAKIPKSWHKDLLDKDIVDAICIHPANNEYKDDLVIIPLSRFMEFVYNNIGA